MYPNLYYIFKDWFGVEWQALSVFNTFGLMVALSFIAAAWVISSELKRKEKAGLLHPREELIVVGKPASLQDIFLNAVTGFVFGYKLIGLFFFRPENMNPQEYIFTSLGSWGGGLLGAALLAGFKWYEKNRTKLPNPERRSVRIWPHDRVGDFVILALVFGIIGAKLFDSIENWQQFVSDPIGTIFSASGLAFYGGLIVAAIAIILYARRKGVNLKHLVDAAAPCLMIAYAVGRIGCQLSGDGDWGIYNSAYTSDEYGKVYTSKPGDFERKLQNHATYFTEGKVVDSTGTHFVTDRNYSSLEAVPRKSFKGPSFLPGWLFAYTYPKNVNKDGILIPGDTDEHNRVLPSPVFPTPLYETIVCGIFFFGMWFIRRKIQTPLVMFGLYLVLNGTERFFMETMRVNKLYNVLGMNASQAEIIAILLVILGIVLITYAKITYRKSE